MQTLAQVTTGLITNLNDLRMHSICLFINDLIERKETHVPRFRIYNTTTSTFIESVEQFRQALSANTMVQQHPYQGEKMSNDRVMAYALIPKNLVVRFSVHSAEDVLYAQRLNYFADLAATYHFYFVMAYMNDGDSVVPVKISSVRLVRAG